MPDNPREIVLGGDHYAAPNAHPVDLEQTKADVLLVHDSDYRVQPAIEELMPAIEPGTYDRLAIPRPSEQIRDSEVFNEWVRILKGKHSFESIIVAEPPKPYQKAARNMLRHHTGLKVEVMPIPLEELELPTALVMHCADLRFQNNFNHHVDEQQYESYVRYAVAGGGLALRHEVVLGWVHEALEIPTVQEVAIYNHTDCAVSGGLAAHNDHEYQEAVVQALELHDACESIRQGRPHKMPKVREHIVGIDGQWNVKALRRQARTAQVVGGN